jgi:hypothetical protein
MFFSPKSGNPIERWERSDREEEEEEEEEGAEAEQGVSGRKVRLHFCLKESNLHFFLINEASVFGNW